MFWFHVGFCGKVVLSLFYGGFCGGGGCFSLIVVLMVEIEEAMVVV